MKHQDSSELPPRARRIQVQRIFPATGSGTTSACAENTILMRTHTWAWRNYLRVRGEYFSHLLLIRPVGELPPRARRILVEIAKESGAVGTTSACAENTRLPRLQCWTHRNYLRVRGEYRLQRGRLRDTRELPPRARRIHIDHSTITK